jgi:hypothetical protein
MARNQEAESRGLAISTRFDKFTVVRTAFHFIHWTHKTWQEFPRIDLARVTRRRREAEPNTKLGAGETI